MSDAGNGEPLELLEHRRSARTRAILEPDRVTYSNPDTGNLITLTGFASYAEGAKAATSDGEFPIENRLAECRG